jgi:hypothetical protein
MPRARAAPRWEDPALDEAALAVAGRIRAVLPALGAARDSRWRTWFEALLPALEDGDRPAIDAAARRARAAFGSGDSVREVWPGDDSLRCRDALDRLLRMLAERAALNRGERSQG